MTKKDFLEIQKARDFNTAVQQLAQDLQYCDYAVDFDKEIVNRGAVGMEIGEFFEKGDFFYAYDWLKKCEEVDPHAECWWWVIDKYNKEKVARPVKTINDIKQFFEKEKNEND